jgi:hypothetical protein
MSRDIDTINDEMVAAGVIKNRGHRKITQNQIGLEGTQS